MDDGVSLVDLKHIFFKQKEIRPSFIFLDCWRGIYSFKTSISLPSERESWLVYLERSGRPPPTPPFARTHLSLSRYTHRAYQMPSFYFKSEPLFVFCFFIIHRSIYRFLRNIFFFFQARNSMLVAFVCFFFRTCWGLLASFFFFRNKNTGVLFILMGLFVIGTFKKKGINLLNDLIFLLNGANFFLRV